MLRNLFLLVVLWGMAPMVSAAPRSLLDLDPFAYILVELGLILAAVVAGHYLARRLEFPTILGELLVGMAIGNLLNLSGVSPFFYLIMHLDDASMLFREVWVSGVSVTDAAGNIFSPEELKPGGLGARLIDSLGRREAPGLLLMGSALWHFSNLGILFLWFRVVLGIRLEDLMQSGRQAFMVAMVGVVVALGLGMTALYWLLPEAGWTTRFLLASGLVPTSASIALPLIAKLEKRFSEIASLAVAAILIADVAAVLLVSSAVTLVQTGEQSLGGASSRVVEIVIYLGIVLYLCRKVSDWTLPWLNDMDEYQAKLLLPLGVVVLMAWIADLLSLSSLIGIFGAGMLLNSLNLEKRCHGKVSTRDMLRPLTQVFAPVFFVLLGMQINLADFFSFYALGLGVLLTFVAILAKLLGSWLVVHGQGWEWLGWVMVPRAEMAMIVAATAKGLGVMGDEAYAAFMLMVIVSMLASSLMIRRYGIENPVTP